MYEEKIVWKNAGTDDFTDAEIKAVGDFIWAHDRLVSKFTGYVYDDIAEECKNGLRSMGYKFECDNIGFDDGYADGHLENLEYVGNALTYFQTGNESVYVEPEFDFNQDERLMRGWCSYPSAGDLQDVIVYNVEVDGDYDNYVSFSDLEELHRKFVIGDEEWNELVDWNTNMLKILESEYRPFIEDVQRLEKSFEDELTLRSREFFLTVLESLSVAFAFMPDGRVIDYEINSSK